MDFEPKRFKAQNWALERKTYMNQTVLILILPKSGPLIYERTIPQYVVMDPVKAGKPVFEEVTNG